MIGTLARLAIRQRSVGVTRLAVMAIASAFATVLILLCAAVWQASGRQEAQTNRLLRPFPIPWVSDAGGGRSYAAPPSVASPNGKPNTRPPNTTVYSPSVSTLAGRELVTIRLGRNGPRAPVPPGIPRLPAPGTAYFSPTLSHLLASSAGALPPGIRAIGRISPKVLAAPDQLVLMLGVNRTTTRVDPVEAAVLSSFLPASGSPSDGVPDHRGRVGNSRFRVVAVAGGLLIALLAFLASAGQFALVSRERRS